MLLPIPWSDSAKVMELNYWGSSECLGAAFDEGTGKWRISVDRDGQRFELAPDYLGRTSLIGFRVFFTYAGILVISVVGFAVFFPPTEQFSNGMLNKASYPNFAMFCAVTGSLAMLLCVVGTRSAIPHLSKPATTHAGERTALLAFVDVFRTLKQTLLVYVATYVFDFQPEQLAGLASSVVVGIIFASVVAQYLSRRFDKKVALAMDCLMRSAI